VAYDADAVYFTHDCPCQFCVALRLKHASGKSVKEELNRAAEDFLPSYSRRALLDSQK
jgi:hypothetical protein